MLIIDILDHAPFFQVGGSQTPGQCAILFPQPLLIDQQRKAFFEAELAGVGGFQLCAEGVGHSVQFHGVKFLDGLLIQHCEFLSVMSRATAPAWWADRSTAVRAGFHGEGRARTASGSSTSWRSSERFRIDFRL